MQLKTNMKSYFSMSNLLPVFLVVLGLNFILQQMKGSEFYVKNKKTEFTAKQLLLQIANLVYMLITMLFLWCDKILQ